MGRKSLKFLANYHRITETVQGRAKFAMTD